MANVTDPLAAAVHGTDPQNLMEYITRQKIYDSRYWKEECFGLTAVNVLEKATQLTCIGASFGGNRQPTKFLCLVLKMLQIHPEDDLVEEFLAADEKFKYVRALGAFYKRLTGRPADIYQSLENLYTDYSRLRYRDITEWKLLHMDEFVHALLTEERVCGIALPRLPQRQVLEEEGYLDDKRRSALQDLLQTQTAEEYLFQKVQMGSEAAKVLWEERQEQKEQRRKEKEQLETAIREAKEKRRWGPLGGSDGTKGNHRRGDHRYGQSEHDERHCRDGDDRGRPRRREGDSRLDDEQGRKSRKRARKDERNYGSLFKSCGGGERSQEKARDADKDGPTPTFSAVPQEGSEEYWNEQRAKLGLKPLRK